MTRRHKDFGAPVLNDELEPVTFTLYGKTFDCYKQINGVVLLRFAHDSAAEDGAKSTAAVLEVFKRVMRTDEYTRFMDLCDDPDTIVPVETLVEIISFLVEVYTARPTKQS